MSTLPELVAAVDAAFVETGRGLAAWADRYHASLTSPGALAAGRGVLTGH